MNARAGSLLHVDWNAFDPWRVAPITHSLGSHPMLQPDALIELGKRLEAVGRVRTHSGQADAATSFNDAPRLHPNRQSALQTLGDIEHANAWMSLLNVQTDGIYRRLVDEVLDDVRPGIDRFDPGMCYRGGWIFVTSPRAVTPFHMDKEHNFIVQIRGTKTLHVWEHDDTETVPEAARDLFHATHSRDLVVWREEARKRARVFHLEPGMGAYMPSTSPHLVENGDGPSITMSFTYYTDATRRNALLHALHQRMRDRGIVPPPVGESPLQDGLAHLGCRGYLSARRVLRRLAGRSSGADDVRYAHATIA